MIALGASLLAYLWATLIMVREHSPIGVALLLLLILLSLAELMATIRRRPSRRQGS